MTCREDTGNSHSFLHPFISLFTALSVLFIILCSLSGHKTRSTQAGEPCQFRAVLALRKRGGAAGETTLGWVLAPALNDAE